MRTCISIEGDRSGVEEDFQSVKDAASFMVSGESIIKPQLLFQVWFHNLVFPPPAPAPTPALPTQSIMPLEYSIGTPPWPQMPVFIMAFLNSLPPSPAPTLSSSHAAFMAFHCRSSSSCLFSFNL